VFNDESRQPLHESDHAQNLHRGVAEMPADRKRDRTVAVNGLL
jgi:hypothetical protein